jgi:hypothetical protein
MGRASPCVVDGDEGEGRPEQRKWRKTDRGREGVEGVRALRGGGQ